MANIDADLILQVNRSHLERVERFLRSHYTSLGDASVLVGAPRIEFLATKRKTASKSCSLIYLRVDDCNAFMEHLSANHRFVLQGVNKYYVMAGERSIVRGGFPPSSNGGDILDEEKHCTSHTLLKLMQKLRRDDEHNKSVRARVGVFPMKLQSNVVKNLSALMDAKCIPEDVLDVVPTGQTHTMSIVEIDARTYLVGIATGSPPPIEKTNTTNDICRAFHKLSEAIQRYHRHQHNPSFPLPKAAGCGKRKCPKPMIAVDCGSAPGGWTKCLIEETACDEVYSIDPGEMDESIASLPNVHHMKMKGAEAIPKLRSILAQKDELVSLWVSDMCVHEVPQQVDTFLLAFREGLFRPDAAFVLTIKCGGVGHTSKRFDALAEAEANRLQKDAGAYGVRIMHLFNNRLGERTICGYVK